MSAGSRHRCPAAECRSCSPGSMSIAARGEREQPLTFCGHRACWAAPVLPPSSLPARAARVALRGNRHGFEFLGRLAAPAPGITSPARRATIASPSRTSPLDLVLVVQRRRADRHPADEHWLHERNGVTMPSSRVDVDLADSVVRSSGGTRDRPPRRVRRRAQLLLRSIESTRDDAVDLVSIGGRSRCHRSRRRTRPWRADDLAAGYWQVAHEGRQAWVRAVPRPRRRVTP